MIAFFILIADIFFLKFSIEEQFFLSLFFLSSSNRPLILAFFAAK
jgi:hypothetical protein